LDFHPPLRLARFGFAAAGFFFAGMLELAMPPGKDERWMAHLRKADKGRRSWIHSATSAGFRLTPHRSMKTSCCK
jgi:hypothetical protein